MKKYLAYKDEKSQKFWQIEVSEKEFTVTYGKIGTDGQSKTKTFDNAEKALKEANKLIAQKMKKGYQEVEEDKDKNGHVEKPTKAPAINYYEALKKFNDEYGVESYAVSFFIKENEDDFFESWLDEVPEEKIKEYAESMKVFAGADGTGARYAFWLKDGNTDVNQAPIVYYGSEGEICMLASDIKDLIKMLSFGQECMDGRFYFDMYDKDDFETEEEFFEDALKYRPNFLTFRKWMKETLGITPVKDWKVQDNEEVNKLVKKAIKKYKKSFDKWQYQFYPDPKDEDAIYEREQQQKYETTHNELLQKLREKASPDLYLALIENETVPTKPDFEQRNQYLMEGHAAFPENLELLKKIAVGNQHRNPKLSLDFYNKLIAKNAIEPKDYSDIASLYRDMGAKEDLEKALAFYTKSILANQNGWEGSVQEKIISVAKELKKDGMAILEDSLKSAINTDTFKVLYKQYFKKKKYGKACEYALKFIEHTDMQAHNYTQISENLMKKNAYEEAILIIKKTIPTHTWDNRKMRSYNDLGLCYIRIVPKETDKALEAFKAGFLLDKKEPALHQNINLCGTYFLEENQVDKAKKVFQFCLDNKIATTFKV